MADEVLVVINDCKRAGGGIVRHQTHDLQHGLAALDLWHWNISADNISNLCEQKDVNKLTTL